jgi:hypothetical protein
MKRDTFLLIGAIGQLFFGIFFLFFTDIAAAQNMKEVSMTNILLEKNLGVFSLGFGIVTFLSRKSSDTIALRALLIGTLFYLIVSSLVDSYGIMKGLFTSDGWGGIGARIVFIIGYIYYLAKMKVDQNVKTI